MFSIMAVSEGAVYTVWGVSILIFAVIIVVVAILLTAVLKTVRQINEVAGNIWTVGKGIANNTVHIPLLITTNRVTGQIYQEAGQILGDAGRIQQHAETCPGCPDCVLTGKGGR